MKEKEFTDTEKKHNDMFRDDENKDHQISVNELWQKWKRSKGTFCKHTIISSLGGDFVYGNFCSGNADSFRSFSNIRHYPLDL